MSFSSYLRDFDTLMTRERLRAFQGFRPEVSASVESGIYLQLYS